MDVPRKLKAALRQSRDARPPHDEPRTTCVPLPSPVPCLVPSPHQATGKASAGQPVPRLVGSPGVHSRQQRHNRHESRRRRARDTDSGPKRGHTYRAAQRFGKSSTSARIQPPRRRGPPKGQTSWTREPVCKPEVFAHQAVIALANHLRA